MGKTDFFVKSITKESIVYQIRDGITGELLMQEKTSPYTTDKSNFYFDGLALNLEMAQLIIETLN